MFIAMNRFKVNQGREQDFIEIWRNRESLLATVPGFKSFNLLQMEKREGAEEGITLFASHAVWQDKQTFEAWTKSDAFRQVHAKAGGPKREGIYAGHPHLELFEAVL